MRATKQTHIVRKIKSKNSERICVGTKGKLVNILEETEEYLHQQHTLHLEA